MKNIRFSVPTSTGRENSAISEALATGKLSGDGEFTNRVVAELEKLTGQSRALLTSSCTHALDMAAMLPDLKPGDEVVMPSFTFVSTANAFVLRGAVPVFVDILPETMNIDETLIEAAITEKTRAIAVMHYGGVACAMDEIMAIAKRHDLAVVEDAAQAVDAYYKDRHLGTIGTFGTFSFHDTKNVTSGGEGGAFLVNDEKYWERARIIREKGTNRAQFFEGIIDKYTWVDVGSSYLMAEINAAFLLPQLQEIGRITSARLKVWSLYDQGLTPLFKRGVLEKAAIPDYARPNGHLFFIKTKNPSVRSALIARLRERGIAAPFHYIPLHSAPAGLRFGRFHGEDRWTSVEAARLLRLPIYHGIGREDVERVVREIVAFYEENDG